MKLFPFMRRLATVAMVPVVYAMMLSGCSPQSSASEGKVITLWHAFKQEETVVFREMIRGFEEEYEREHGIPLRVELTYVSYDDMFTKLRTAAMARITPDIAFLDSIKVTDLAFGKGAIPVNELEGFIERYGTIENAAKEFVPASFDAGIVNRLGVVNLYGLPVQTTTVALFWNRQIFRERAADLRAAGLDPSRAPRDWDELIAYGLVLNSADGSVFGYGMHGSMWFNFPVFNMYGLEFIEYNEDGTAKAVVNTPRGRAAFERILKIANSGAEGGAWRRANMSPDQGFLNRRYAMMLTGPWSVENLANAGLEFDIALIPGPSQQEIDELDLGSLFDPESNRGSNPYSSSNVGGQTGVIMRTCEDPELAYKVLEFFTSEPVQRRWASQLGQIPVRLAAWEDLDTSRYPFMPIFMEQLLTAKRIPQIPLYGTLESEIFNPEMDLLLQGSQTPEQMLTRMERQMESMILSRMNNAIEGMRGQ